MANPPNPEARLRSGDFARTLMDLCDAYKVDGDVMECRFCKARIVATRMSEVFRHRDERNGKPCRMTGAANPWWVLREAVNAIGDANLAKIIAGLEEEAP